MTRFLKDLTVNIDYSVVILTGIEIFAVLYHATSARYTLFCAAPISKCYRRPCITSFQAVYGIIQNGRKKKEANALRKSGCETP